MKKALTVAFLVMVTGVAYASTLAVPFYLDNAPNDGNFPPGSGTASYIGIRNNTDRAIEMGVRYFQANGTEWTPTENSYTIPPLSAVAWRPVGDDTVEGVGRDVPNVAAGAPAAGACVVNWVGLPTDLQGRMVQVSAVSGGTYHSIGYLLPPGVSTQVAK